MAHGERGGAGDDRLVHRLVERLGASGRFAAVAAGFIRSQPSVAEAHALLPDGPVTVYPLFMSAGYYVATAIPRALELDGENSDGRGRRVVVASPLGLDPGLPGAVIRLAAARAATDAIDPLDATLLLVAHGSSKDANSRNATLRVAGAIERTRQFERVETAFLEEEPYLGDTLRSVRGPAVVVGLFVGEGMHGGEDLPQAVAECGRDDIVLAEPLGQSGEIMTLVCRSAESVAAGNTERSRTPIQLRIAEEQLESGGI